MRVALLALAFIAFSTSAVAARWSGPGWYQITDGLLGVYIFAGPFSDADSCRRTLLPDDENNSYECDYLAERPSYDM
jgi:hypothetical protein